MVGAGGSGKRVVDMVVFLLVAVMVVEEVVELYLCTLIPNYIHL